MTHNQITASPDGLTGGYIHPEAFKRIFEQAVKLGVTDFVVPGNKPDRVAVHRTFLEDVLGEGNFTLYSPGLIAQGGSISEGGAAAGRNWHGIVGRGIFNAADVRATTIEYASLLTGGLQ
jgi:orotidine-5'-phosphate decarboxylase